jgi:hypothetical protein
MELIDAKLPFIKKKKKTFTVIIGNVVLKKKITSERAYNNVVITCV